MSNIAFKPIVVTPEIQANFTEENHLGYLLQEKPVSFSVHMDRLFSTENIYSQNPLKGGLNGFVSTETEDNTEWEWKLKGADIRPAEITAKFETGDVVKGKRSIKVAFDKNFYVYGDTLRPLIAPDDVQFRIISGGEQMGDSGYVYYLEPIGKNNSAIFPTKYFEVGQLWNKLYTPLAEATDKRGSTQFGGTVGFRNRMSFIGKKYKVTDLASQRILTVAIPDSSGNKHLTWIRYADVEFMRQWEQENERLIMMSVSTDSNFDNQGRPIRMGDGVFQQVKNGGNTHYVNYYTTRMVEDYLMGIFYGRKSPNESRAVKGFTGEYGLIEMNSLGKQMLEDTGFVLSVDTVARKIKSPYNNNAFEVGFQFTRLNLANNTSLEMVHHPLFDDRNYFSAIDPITGKPAKSQELLFLDFAGKGKNNIVIKEKRDGFRFGYFEGMVSALGKPKKGGQLSHVGSWYEMHIERYLGVEITDNTKTGILGKNILI